MWSHREDLLKVARRRSASFEDAEDAVHEAMLRAAEHPNVDDERLGAWLTTVTMRLCVDRHRQVRRDDAVHSRSVLAPSGPVPVDEVVCDRAEAKWLAERSMELPARQAKALRLQSEGRDVGQIAREMGLSYEAVESLLARARRALRRSLAGTMAAAAWLWGRGKVGAGGGAPAAATASAATVVVLVLVASHSHHEAAQLPAPQSSSSYSTAAPHHGGGRPAAPGHVGATAAGTTTPARVRQPMPAAPEVVRLPLPTLPSQPLDAVPRVPTAPRVSTVPFVPSAPSFPAVPHPPAPSGHGAVSSVVRGVPVPRG
ncbi:sigma-70 family RNA polymerase sigma factor [Streptomyces sp. RB6PN25]|uniref:Sigma-70 family RNA polymerase sigma factor n=1 Tax=Streptomyces humicola TaxID=2953240 RepID=A0ABT1Q292_9ACTN|nr:sigma-70 family RNA polymerase sigma factor [Streptomyces humicola]MCQ4084041.1 sigma-70 family RNA polymerase sigma factor [Streptomyces humicola]